MTIAPGDIISDRYRIVDQLGEGGMGAVFRAEHVHMKKMVALKVLLGELARHPEVVARFEREAVAAANIEHPNIVNATDFGKLADGSFFLVMEYVPGRSLRMELGTGMALEPARAIRIARGILSAIDAAHAKNIVHRDLKPENVMLVERDGDRDFVKVLDFGIAKVDMISSDEDQNPEGKKLTRTGAVIGTPEYMAPEQALGQQVDARSDLYSLGVMLYEMLTGKPPFHGPAIVVMRKQVLEAAPPLPAEVASAMPGIVPVLEKLLQKEPQNRHQTANELRAALGAIEGAPASSPRLPVATESGRISIASLPGPMPSATADTVAPPAASVAAPKTAEAPSRRRHVVIGGGALLGIVSLVAIALSFSSSDDAKAHPTSHHASASSSVAVAAQSSATTSASASASALASADDDDDKDDDAPAGSATAASTAHSKAGTASTGTKPAQKRPRRSSGGGGNNIINDFKKLFK